MMDTLQEHAASAVASKIINGPARDFFRFFSDGADLYDHHFPAILLAMEALVSEQPGVFMAQFAAALDDTELVDWILNEFDPDEENDALRLVSRHCRSEDILAVLEDVVYDSKPTYERAQSLVQHIFSEEQRDHLYQDPYHTELNIEFLAEALRVRDYEAVQLVTDRVDNYSCDVEGAVRTALEIALVEHPDDPEVLDFVLSIDWGHDDASDLDISTMVPDIVREIHNDQRNGLGANQLTRVAQYLDDKEMRVAAEAVQLLAEPNSK